MPQDFDWEPTKITRVVDFLSTSTKPIMVETDDGLALVKYIGNPQGVHTLVAEYVAASLARLVGLPIPDFAIVYCPEIEIERYGIVTVAGPAFASRWVSEAASFSPSSSLLENLRDIPLLLQNPKVLVGYDAEVV